MYTHTHTYITAIDNLLRREGFSLAEALLRIYTAVSHRLSSSWHMKWINVSLDETKTSLYNGNFHKPSERRQSQRRIFVKQLHLHSGLEYILL